MSCFNRINGCGCAMKCTNGNDERYPLVDNGKGGQKCTCPICLCPCQAIYRLDSVNAIKMGLLCEKGDPNLSLSSRSTASTLKPSFSSNESEHVVAKKLRASLDYATKLDEKSLLKSDSSLTNIQETAFEVLVPDMTKELQQHGTYLSEFRQQWLPNMSNGAATMIQSKGKMFDVRALHNSSKWSHRRYHNNLNTAVIELLDDANDNSLTDTDANGKENDDPGTFAAAKSSLKYVDDLDDTASYNNPKALYEAVQSYCFDQAEMLGSDTQAYFYQQLFAHLQKGCQTCEGVCTNAIRFYQTVTVEQATKKLEAYLSHHYD